MIGWIKLQRKLLTWEWFKTPNMVQLFIYILLKANHAKGFWQGNEILKGQLITGIKTLHNDTNISEQTLRTCLKRLQKTKEINIQSTNKFSIITINNYESYQDEEITTNKQINKQLTINQQTTNKQLTTNNNNKELNNEDNKEKIKRRELNLINPKTINRKYFKLSEILIKDISEHWKFNDGKHSGMITQISYTIDKIIELKQIDLFTKAFYHYKYFIKEQTYKHNLMTYLGTEANNYIDGSWYTKNWIEELKEFDKNYCTKAENELLKISKLSEL